MKKRILDSLFIFLRKTWITGLALIGIASACVLSLDSARWIEDEKPLIACLLFGMLLGGLIGKSRFKAWFAGLYAVILAAFLAVQTVGKIAPSLSELLYLPLSAMVDQMNLRAVSFSLRVGGWIDTLNAGQNIRDNGLFILLFGFLLALCGMVLLISLIRGKQALIGVLPLGILLAVNIQLSQQPLVYWMYFLLFVLFLIARKSFEVQQEGWLRRRVDYPEQIGLEWTGAAVALTILIVGAARLAPFIGTSEGRLFFESWTNRFQDQTTNTVTRLFSGVTPPPPSPLMKKVVYVNTPNLAEIGRPIAQGSDVVMWVRISDPLPAPQGSGYNGPVSIPYIHYWRNAIFDSYNGRGWKTAAMKDSRWNAGQAADPSTSETIPAPGGRYLLRQEFELAARHTTNLFSVNDPVQAGVDVVLRETQADASRLLEGTASKYQVVSAATQVTSTQLETASTVYPNEIRAAYLQLPDELPSRVRRLAERVVSGANTPYQKAVRIQNYLRQTYPYDLQVGKAPAGRDVVDYFLFDEPRGFCSHYASAMAVMLRAVGVPARVVTGYAMGGFDPRREAFQVTESAAHAWVEVYFPEFGWVEFEPTASRSPIEYPEDRSLASGRAANPSAQPNVPQNASPIVLALIGLGTVIILAGPFALLYLFSSTRRIPALSVPVLYRRMRWLLRWGGVTALPSITPAEFVSQTAGQLAPYPNLSQALTQATGLYCQSLFSPFPVEDRQVQKVHQLWRHAARDMLRLWMNAVLKRFHNRGASLANQSQPRRW